MPDFSSPIFIVFIAVVGACIGSFLNVCIYRIPLEVSLVKPRSHCATCGALIPAYHNIPVLSWLFLRGRAACCGTRIDARYAIVELLTSLLFLLLWLRFPPTEFLAYAVLVSGLMIASCIDIDHFIIPDRFTIGGCIPGFIACTLVPSLQQQTTAYAGFRESLWGAFIGLVVLFVVSKAGSLAFRKEALGMGDVKFLAAIGSFLGWKATLYVLAVSSVIGSVFGVLLLLRKERTWGTRMPYGPFLAIAAVLWLFHGQNWIGLYVQSWHNILSEPGTP